MEGYFMSAPSLMEQDRACIWHPFTQMHTTAFSIPIVRAKGLYLYDENGMRYADGISSWWVNLHGHAHPYIAEKIATQAKILEHVLFAGFTHPPAVHLASRLLQLLPGQMSKIFYSDNGSTAVECAIKMALQYWYNQDCETKKLQIICFRNSYHGDTFGAMSASGKNAFNKPFWKHLFEVKTIDLPQKGGDSSAYLQLQAILSEEKAACFIFEPLVLGTGGMLTYPPDALNALIRLCKEHRVLTIADEVMTGFGRTDTLFACAQLSESPDLICLSKGLTGGFLPLGVTACTESIFNAFLGSSLSQAFLHGHSYTANPLACTSALASLDLLLEHSCLKQREMIAASHAAFCLKWKNHPCLRRCEHIGTLLIVEYHSGRPSSYFEPIGKHLYRFFLTRGILLRPLGNVLYLMPPYCIQMDELQWIQDQIILSLEEK